MLIIVEITLSIPFILVYPGGVKPPKYGKKSINYNLLVHDLIQRLYVQYRLWLTGEQG